MEEQFNKFSDLFDKAIRLSESVNNVPTESDQTDQLNAALAAACVEGPSVDKSGKNNHQNYKYAKIEDMIAVWQPLLGKHGLSITQKLVTLGGNFHYIFTRLRHSSGQWCESRFKIGWIENPSIDQNKNLQNLGAAITYTKKYAYGSLIGVSYGEDDDLQTYHK